jgi:hypothetical protein
LPLLFPASSAAISNASLKTFVDLLGTPSARPSVFGLPFRNVVAFAFDLLMESPPSFSLFSASLSETEFAAVSGASPAQLLGDLD